MNICRICRTQENLKYAPEELNKSRLKNYSKSENEIMDENACNLGNICYDCEERLLSFSKLSDSLDLDGDSGRGETPIIVDDEDFLYNFFFKKMKLHQEAENQKPQQPLLHSHCHLSVTPSAASSENDVEIVQEQQQEKVDPQIVDFIDLAVDDSDYGCDEKLPVKNKQRKRSKHLDESKIHLLSTLNLVSSDSEEDELCILAIRDTKEITPEATYEKPPTNGCPVCLSSFGGMGCLLHHMRSRHRDNEQETELRECERLKHDSALTIRLCYRSSVNCYECQLCGKIDLQLKVHQEHVVKEHSAELRSLKDPLLQRNYCAICNAECDGPYIELCRHMLDQHKSSEYKCYLTEVKKNTQVPAHVKKWQSAAEASARVYQFKNCPHWYFQCRKCSELSSSLKTHQRHLLDEHKQDDKEKKESKIPVRLDDKPKRPQSARIAFKESANHRQTRGKNYKYPAINKKIEEVKKPTKKVDKIKEAKKPTAKVNQIRETQKRTAKVVNVGELKKRTAKERNNPKTTIAAKVLKKVCAKTLKPKREKRKKTARSHVKALLQVPTQSYKCNYCSLSMEGFIKLNLHILQVHADDEFFSCHRCARSFANRTALEVHEKSHGIDNSNDRSQRRKCSSKTT